MVLASHPTTAQVYEYLSLYQPKLEHIIFLPFETGSETLYVIQDGLEVSVILLLLFPKYWDSNHVTPCTAENLNSYNT